MQTVEDNEDRALAQTIDEATKAFHELATLTRSQLTENEAQNARRMGKYMSRELTKHTIDLAPKRDFIDTSKLDAYQKYMYYTTPAAKHKFLFRDRKQQEEKRNKTNMITAKGFQSSSYKLLSGGAIHCNINRDVIGGVRHTHAAANDVLSDTVIRHHHFLSTHPTLSEAETQPTNAHMKEICKRMRKLLEELWEEMSVPQLARTAFQADYYYPETMDNYSRVFAEITRLDNMRNQQHVLPKLIERREIMLQRLQSLLPQFNPSSSDVRQKTVQNEIVNVIFELRRITCQVVEGITMFRRINDKPQPYVWQGSNYMLKLQTDLSWMKNTTFQKLLSISVDNNPFLLPDRKTGQTFTRAQQETRTTETFVTSFAQHRDDQSSSSRPPPTLAHISPDGPPGTPQRSKLFGSPMASPRTDASATHSPKSVASIRSVKGPNGKPVLILPPNTTLTDFQSQLSTNPTSRQKSKSKLPILRKPQTASTPDILQRVSDKDFSYLQHNKPSRQGSRSSMSSHLPLQFLPSASENTLMASAVSVGTSSSAEDDYIYPSTTFSFQKSSSCKNMQFQTLSPTDQDNLWSGAKLKYQYPASVMRANVEQLNKRSQDTVEEACCKSIIHMLTPSTRKALATKDTENYKKNPEEYWLNHTQFFDQKFAENFIAKGKLPPTLKQLLSPGNTKKASSLKHQFESLVMLKQEVTLNVMLQYEAVINDEHDFLQKLSQQEHWLMNQSMNDGSSLQLGSPHSRDSPNSTNMFNMLESKVKQASLQASTEGGLQHIGKELLHQLTMQKVLKEHGVQVDDFFHDEQDDSDWSTSEEENDMWGDGTSLAYNKTYDNALEIARGL